MLSERNADCWIEKLSLTEHPEGGCLAPDYRLPKTFACGEIGDPLLILNARMFPQCD
jgi:predicted cupin superfamily sugar epimerase